MQTLRKLTLLSLFCFAVSCIFCGCASEEVKIKREASQALDEKLSEQAEYTISNEAYSLTLQTDTTHFLLTDKKTGTAYSSVPEFSCSTESEETKKRFVSEVSLVYYDKNSISYSMYSGSDSVEKGGATVESDGERIRVTYTFGDKKLDEFVPTVLTKEAFESIGEKLSNSQLRRYKLYYKLYSASAPEEDFKEKAEIYPAIKNHDLYVLNDSITKLDRSNIHSYMNAVGYTKEDYQKDIQEFQITEAKDDTAGFTVPVEYSLTDRGMTAKILTDLITENSKEFKLATIDLLPFFAAKDNKEKGYFLVPDGSGAVIEMNSIIEGYYSRRIYGSDVSVHTDGLTMLSEQQSMPVYGMSCQDSAYVAVVEGAAAMADINVSSYNVSNPANCAWTTFHYRVIETQKNTSLATSKGNAQGNYNIYREIDFTELPAVTYILDDGGKNYTELASTYREYLEEEKGLEVSDNHTPVLLDFLCSYRVEKTVFGVSYTEHVTLTTLSQITEILQDLYESGMEDISIRLQGYSDGGLFHGVYTKLSLLKSVGTEKELQELAELVAAHGGTLYLEGDFQTTYQDQKGDGYSQRSDSAYYTNKRIVTIQDYHLVTKKYDSQQSAIFISPNRYQEFAQSFAESLQKKELVTGISYANAGQLLGGDYSKKGQDRDWAAQQIAQVVMEGTKDTKILVGGANQYAVLPADVATNVSVTSSAFDVVAETVPFWQMVFHGSLPYSAEAANLADNKQLLDLKSLEYGCTLHYMLTGEADDKLLGQYMQEKYHSLYYKNWMDDLKAQYHARSSFMKDISAVNMISNKKIAKGVYQTNYENGCYSVVNYGEQEYAGGQYVVAPYSYYLKGVN